jgi:hypothetical protein
MRIFNAIARFELDHMLTCPAAQKGMIDDHCDDQEELGGAL